MSRHLPRVLSILSALCLPTCGSNTPSEGPIVSSQCTTTFSPCGGSLDGTWAIDSVCFDADYAAMANADMDRDADCLTQTKAADYTASGTMNFKPGSGDNDNIVVLDTTSKMRISDSVNSDCAKGGFGQSTLDDAACTEIKNKLESKDPPKTVTCAMAKSNCDCTTTISQTQKTQDTYKLDGASKFEQGDGSKYEFCVRDNVLTLRKEIIDGVNLVTRLKKR